MERGQFATEIIIAVAALCVPSSRERGAPGFVATPKVLVAVMATDTFFAF